MPLRVLALVIDYRTSAETEALTLQLGESVRTGFELEVVHVDNGNITPVQLTAAQTAAGIHLLRVPHNGGYASGIRHAIEICDPEATRYDAYWMLNSDLELEPDALTRLSAVLMARPHVGAVGPTVYHGRTDRVWGARGGVSPVFGSTSMEPWPEGGVLPRWSYIPGCSLLARASAYHEVGGIMDRYGMYYEETDLCVQLQRRGWELYVEPAARVYHSAGSLEGAFPSEHRAFYFVRNNLYFWERNFGIPWFVQLPRTLAMIGRHLLPPLLKAPSPRLALDRLRFMGMGLIDGFAFRRHRFTHFERKHFDLEPR